MKDALEYIALFCVVVVGAAVAGWMGVRVTLCIAELLDAAFPVS